ncbi:MAG: hypothetical protein J5725_12505 [Bacteroidales bacterium]|nr:hypothetical protein [Bacteroidales bacterium]
MNNDEVKQILYSNRPNRPQKPEKRRLQQAIDSAIQAVDMLDQVTSIKLQMHSKWRKDKDTLKCTGCGFGYFPTDLFFMNGDPIITSTSGKHYYMFKYCPNCGKEMQYVDK